MNAVWKWARIGVCPMTATGRISGGVVPLNARAYDYFACYRLAHAGFLIDWLLPSELPARLPHLSVLITDWARSFRRRVAHRAASVR
jgi:hypothetical protein